MPNAAYAARRTAVTSAGLLLLLLVPVLSAQEPLIPPTLRDEVVRTLTDEMTQRWFPACLDRDRGGFHENYARDWSPTPDSQVSIVYQSRQTWTAAEFATFDPAHHDEFAQYALHGAAFLRNVLWDEEQGGFHWSLGPDGKISPALGDEKHVYGHAFGIYALAKIHEVTGDAPSKALAMKAFDWLEQHAHDPIHGGYFEALARDGTPLATEPDFDTLPPRNDRLGIPHGYKTMNSHIHLLEALSALARIDDRPLIRQRLDELHALVRDTITAPPGALHLYLTRDWKPVPAHDSFGHDVETAFLLVEAAETLGRHDDDKTWTTARRLVDHALQYGWDTEHGGFYDKGDSVGSSAYDTTKVWWTQAEGLNALLLLHEKFGHETDRYARAFLLQWRFIRDHQLDPTNQGWFGEVTREGKPIGDGRKGSPWKASYHTGRSLMQVARMLDPTSANHKP